MIPYYKFKDNHKEITGREEAISIYEVLYFVEGPALITGVDIWRYSQDIPIIRMPSNHNERYKFRDYQLDRVDIEAYPYKEVLMRICRGEISSPLTFEELPDKTLRCIEGRHRLKVMLLLYKLEKKFEKVPGVIVQFIEEREEKVLPKNYHDYATWIEAHNLYHDTERVKELYAKLIREE